jgi:lipopolysaccharide export system permease protein
LKLITKYLLKEHIGPLVFAASTLTSLLLLNFIAKRFDQLIGKGLPVSVILEFFALSVPFTVAMTLPMAVLIATLYAFSRLSADSEITALMASGIGARQLLRPVLAMGVAFSLLMIVFNDQLLPRTNLRLNKLMVSISQKKPTLALKEQVINQVSDNSSSGALYLRMSRLESDINRMHEVTIYDLSSEALRRTIVADSGDLGFAQNGRDLLLTLYDGYVQETAQGTPTRFQRIFFTRDILRVQDVADTLALGNQEGYKGDREMTICELQQVIDDEHDKRDSAVARLTALDPSTPAAASRARRGWLGSGYCAIVHALSPVATAGAQSPSVQKTLPPGAVDQAVARKSIELELERAELRMLEYSVEVHKKFAISLACLIFALLGPPIALRFPRGGIGMTIGVSLGVFALYYVGLIAGEPLGDSGKVPPAIAMWATNALIGSVALVLAWRMGRAGATARGGDLSELWERLIPARWRRNA